MILSIRKNVNTKTGHLYCVIIVLNLSIISLVYFCSGVSLVFKIFSRVSNFFQVLEKNLFLVFSSKLLLTLKLLFKKFILLKSYCEYCNLYMLERVLKFSRWFFNACFVGLIKNKKRHLL